MNEKHHLALRKAPSAARGSYCAPKLKAFGPVGALTQAGSMMDGELMAMGCGGGQMQDPMC